MSTTVADLAARKACGEPIVLVTAYDYPSARLAEAAGVDVILVGDSLGMTMLGYDTTLPVTLDDMIRHAGAVVRGAPNALVICDLPFLTYTSIPDAIAATRRVMQETGAQAVKLEGGAAVVPIVADLVSRGVPVMGHLGFTPQSQHQIGLKVQGKRADQAETLRADALALEQAGAFAVVLELTPEALAREITQSLSIPTIGIGAGPNCDGQVQVWHDMLNLGLGKVPRHAKVFGEIGQAVKTALEAYAAEVREHRFPACAK